MQPGHVYQNKLRIRFGSYSQYSMTGRLWFSGGDTYVGAHEAVDEGRFANVGFANQAYEPGTVFTAHGVSENPARVEPIPLKGSWETDTLHATSNT